ncbi:MAG: trypsin-like peptidase domain-containing protein [Sphingobacteriales bacterium]|nr:trypsin-like peptidase domain-containing protein [Sphingobacteriales bacterium]
MEEILLLDAAERYLRGEMTPQEKTTFEEMRHTNPELDQLVVEHHFFLEEMNRYSNIKAFKNTLQETQAKLEAEGVLKEKELGPGARVVNLWKRYKKTIAIAASIAGVTSLLTYAATNIVAPKADINQVTELSKKLDVLTKKTDYQGNELIKVKGDIKVPNVQFKSSGTGFLIDGKGYLATNAHIIKNSSTVIVQNNKGEEFIAKIVLMDNAKDLAILKITDQEFKPLTLPYGISKSSTEIAEPIYTFGYPRNEIVYGEGYLSAKTGFNGDTLSCQIDVPANPGNSGGPVFNENGEVIGILSTRQMQTEGAVFAIQSKYIYKALEELKKNDAYADIKISTMSSVRKMQRKAQARKVQDFIFMVKGN